MTTEPKFGELMDDSEEELDKRLDSMSIEDPMLIPVLMQREYISRQNAADDTMLTSLASIGLAVYAIMVSLSLYFYETYGWTIEITILSMIVALALIIGAIFILYFAAQLLKKIASKITRLLRRNKRL